MSASGPPDGADGILRFGTFTFVIQGTDDNRHALSVTLMVPTTG